MFNVHPVARGSRHVLAVVLSTVLVALVAACGSGGDANSSRASEAPQPGGTLTIASINSTLVVDIVNRVRGRELPNARLLYANVE